MLIRDEAYARSLDLLKTLSTDAGFLASNEHVENYERVWARDGIIAGIASLLSGDTKLIAVFKKTLETLSAHQDETGRIPSNVTPETGRTSYGTTVGRVDATIWYVIGVIAFTKSSNDHSFFSTHRASVERALFYLKCLELNGRGLLYIPQGGDWADEYINHAYVLYDEMLYYFALSAFASLTKDERVTSAKKHLSDLIRVNYFPKKENLESPLVYNKTLYKKSLDLDTPQVPASYFTNHSIHFNLDTFAISLLLMSDILETDTHATLRKHVLDFGLNKDFPILPAFDPVITEKDYEWKRLALDFLYEFRNKPNEYHNGGLWPLVHGFFISTLPQNEGFEQLDAFAQVLARDSYIFPEFYHGKTFKALGTKDLSFSASAYIIAYEAIVHRKSFFTTLTT